MRNRHSLPGIDKITGSEERRKMIEISVYEFFRWHLVDDCVARELIKRNNNEHTKGSVALIARNYQVARTLRLGSGENKQLIANILNDAVRHWPDGLNERADVCGKLAEKFREKYLSTRECLPSSAITKLIWFLRPDNWTLYDSFASNALISKGLYPNSVVRMKKFYCELDARNFSQTVGVIQEIVNRSEFPTLAGGRVIDKFLMLAGMDENGRQQSMDHTKIFYANMPSSIRSKLSELAAEINEACADDFLRDPEYR